MVEALIVIPFFLVVFASAVFLFHLYSSVLSAQQSARETAWAAAIEGCGVTDDGGKPLPGAENVDLGAAAAIPGTQLCKEGFGVVAIHKDTFIKAPALIGAFTYKANPETVLVCNEKPKPGNFDGAAEYLWKLLEEPELLK